jgi:antitoxin HicB
MEYAALFEPAEEGGFVITIPDFGWGVSQGDTEAEAREMAAALLQTLVQEHIRKRGRPAAPNQTSGKEIPVHRPLGATRHEGRAVYGLPRFRPAKGRVGAPPRYPKTTVDRLFDLDNHTRLDQIEAAFSVLGKRLLVEVADAA